MSVSGGGSSASSPAKTEQQQLEEKCDVLFEKVFRGLVELEVLRSGGPWPPYVPQLSM